MGRPQTFDTDTALDAALSVFWDKGMHRASIDDVLDATGLSRSSLYHAYGGKQALFEQVVQRYVDGQSVCMSKVLETDTLQEALQKLFHSAVTDNFGGRGCLLVNCASNIQQEEEFEQKLLHEGFKRLLFIVQKRIALAQEAGEVSHSVDPKVAATLVCASLSGLRVFHKAGMQKARLKKAADLAVATLLQQLE